MSDRLTTVISEPRELAAPSRFRLPAAATARPRSGLRTDVERWVRSQVTNTARGAEALRPFRRDEFGKGAASPSEAHRRAANKLLVALRDRLLAVARRMAAAGVQAKMSGDQRDLQDVAALKDRVVRQTRITEQVWDFYFELFYQRRTHLAPMLLATDRIGLDCYQAVYTGLGKARSVPSPAPYSYMETRRAPATLRRGVHSRMLGSEANPFPLIKIPYSRLVNPWTLGAVPHEVAHNLQADLGMWRQVPRRIHERLLQESVEPAAVAVWVRWHKEIFADLAGVLLIGPAFLPSLIDVVGRSPARVVFFNPRGVHPTPYLRVLINLELLQRLGFERQADRLRRLWLRIYSRRLAERLPAALMRSFQRANRLVVDTVCFTPYDQLGGKSLAMVTRFKPRDQLMVEEAAQRLASGTNTGILPERYLIGAARLAFERRLARPRVIVKNFYEALARR